MTSVFHSFPPAPGPDYVTVGEQDGELNCVPSGQAKTKVFTLSLLAVDRRTLLHLDSCWVLTVLEK